MRGTGRNSHFQNHVILRIGKDATPEIMDGLLPGNLRYPVDHVINRSQRNRDSGLRPTANIIIFREQRNGQRDLEITLIGSQQNLMAGSGR